jgi:hypothetical protein
LYSGYAKTSRERSSSPHDKTIRIQKLRSKEALNLMSKYSLELLVDQLQTQLREQQLINKENEIKVEQLH